MLSKGAPGDLEEYTYGMSLDCQNKYELSSNIELIPPMKWNHAFGFVYTNMIWTSRYSYLTNCGLMTPYGDIDLGQYWLK